jgi:polyphosphate kinase 2
VVSAPVQIDDMEGSPPYTERLRSKEYEHTLLDLQIELAKVQRWIKEERERVLVIFEGRDAAGKGGAIRRFTEFLNPRGARVVALPKPSDSEVGQWYFQRYVGHLPAAGEVVFFDRSWYNRAGVERVMGFCTAREYVEFMRQAPELERSLVTSGLRLFKLWFTVSREEQSRRFEHRKTDPLRQWKLSQIDLQAQDRWDDYTEARNAVLTLTDTRDAPWTIVNSNDKRRARLEAIRHVLSELPYANKDTNVARAPDLLVVQAASKIEIPAPGEDHHTHTHDQPRAAAPPSRG